MAVSGLVSRYRYLSPRYVSRLTRWVPESLETQLAALPHTSRSAQARYLRRWLWMLRRLALAPLEEFGGQDARQNRVLRHSIRLEACRLYSCVRDHTGPAGPVRHALWCLRFRRMEREAGLILTSRELIVLENFQEDLTNPPLMG